MHRQVAKVRQHLDRGGFALVDQVVVGGMNFLTMILVGRVAGAHQLGLFALGLSIVFLILAAQESIITTPATILSPRLDDGQRRRYFGAALVMQATLSAAVCLILLSAASVAWFGFGQTEGALGFAVLAFAAPLWCLREFCRRFAFAQLNARDVLALDVCVAVLLGASLAGLTLANRLNASTAFAAAGISTGIGATCWLLLRRRDFRIDVTRVGTALRENMVTGRWILSGQVASIATAESMPWIIAGMLGTEATGVFAACRAIFRVANPIVVTVSNLITPYAAHAYVHGGQSQVNSIVRSTMLGMGALMTTFLLILAIVGGQLLGGLFGPEFTRHYWVLIILAAGQLALLMRMGPSRGLLVVDKPQLGVAAEILGCVVLVTSSIPLIAAWGLHGAAGSVLLATTLATLVCIAFYHHVSGQAQESNLAEQAQLSPETRATERQAIAAPCLEAAE